MSDSAAMGPGELAVQRGQQVEVIESPGLQQQQGPSGMVLVRLVNGSQEGLVPLSCLKQPSGGFKFKTASASKDEGRHLLSIYTMMTFSQTSSCFTYLTI